MDFDIITIFLALIVLINPLYAAMAVFLISTRKQPLAQSIHYAATACLSTFLIITVCAVCGSTILSILGISVGAFQMAGGILIFLIALNIMNGDGNPTKPNEEDLPEELIRSKHTASAVVPLAMPLLIGPGGISTTIVYASNASSTFQILSIVLAGGLVSLINFGLLMASKRINALLGDTGIDIITRIMGLLLAAVAIEIFASGTKAVFQL